VITLYIFPLTGCGAVVNNTLRSPGFPNVYPPDMDCVYSVSIPQGMALKITFGYFDLEGSGGIW